VLEITESVMMRDTQASLAILRELKDLGVRLAIDDFGTGYSSLGYLRQFPFDILKIDRSYLATGGEHSNDQDLERAIVDLGRTLKLEIVAEGVEQAEQLVRLKSLHCERSARGSILPDRWLRIRFAKSSLSGETAGTPLSDATRQARGGEPRPPA